jgi:hypothetical protein
MSDAIRKKVEIAVDRSLEIYMIAISHKNLLPRK